MCRRRLSRPAPGGRRSTKRESTDVSTADHSEVNRRDFLYIATGAVGGVGVALAAWPFINQMNPDASVLAMASVEVDLAPMVEGQEITIKWRGNPVFMRHRTEPEIAAAKAVEVSELPDPLARNANLPDGDPATDVNRVVGGKENIIVMMGVCTHLGCVPIRQRGRLSRSSKAMPRSAAGSAPATARTTIPPAASAKARRRRTWRCRSTATSPTPRSASVKKDHPHERTFDLSAQERLRKVVP